MVLIMAEVNGWRKVIPISEDIFSVGHVELAFYPAIPFMPRTELSTPEEMRAVKVRLFRCGEDSQTGFALFRN